MFSCVVYCGILCGVPLRDTPLPHKHTPLIHNIVKVWSAFFSYVFRPVTPGVHRLPMALDGLSPPPPEHTLTHNIYRPHTHTSHKHTHTHLHLSHPHTLYPHTDMPLPLLPLSLCRGGLLPTSSHSPAGVCWWSTSSSWHSTTGTTTQPRMIWASSDPQSLSGYGCSARCLTLLHTPWMVLMGNRLEGQG